ncbi:19315_t:CDS:2 [Funneliformis geosporum]|uniref:19315_t:CDS:1 n=1 Tax=Funneliformis geosporum TaxID=1117311 RepID=A0A9W4SD65_9GLOM|nr:19315_t:CDS:2 [Funneliformis geosporum]
MCLYIAGSSRGKRSRSGELYFNEFQTQFWLRPITRFDIIRDTVMGPQRRQSRNRYAHNPPSQTLNNQRQSPSQSLGEGSSKVGK